MAYSQCPKMPVIPVEWHGQTEVTSIRKEEQAFMFRTRSGGKAFSFAVTFPAIGGVRITQSKGFFDSVKNLPIEYSGKKTVKLSAGGQIALFRRDAQKGFVLDIQNGAGATVLTVSGDHLQFGMAGNKIKKVKKMKFSADFARGDVLYGMGERYNTFDQVGHDLLMWNVDTAIHNPAWENGLDHNESYQNIPVLHSTAGYMIFFNTMYGGWADFGKQTPYQYSFDFNGPVTDFYVFTGTPKDNLKSYTDLTGHSIVPPKWVFQYWMGGGASAWNVDNRPYQEVLQSYLDGYAAMGIDKVAAVYGEGDPSKNEDGYKITQKTGTRMLIWNHPSQNREFAKQVLGTDDPAALPFLTRPGFKLSRVAHNDNWLDFSHPNAEKVLRAFYRKYFDWGLKGAMIDFGEFVSADTFLYNGKDGNAMHQEHSYLYAQTMKKIFEERLGDDFILFQRSGCAGTQGLVGQFGGDQAARFYGLKQAVCAGITMGASGYNIWGSDIGGYHGQPTPELYMRWLEYATFSPLMRAHGIGYPRNPWDYGEEAVTLFKRLYWWRENMLDYLYSAAIHAHLTAEPIMRAMAIEFPDQPLEKEGEQYMFGSELLVAPVTEEYKRCKMVAFPAGSWVDLWTAQTVAGGRSMMVDAPENTIPVYLRAGAAMLLQMAKTLEIGDTMADGDTVPVLLTTPAERRREVQHHFDVRQSAVFVTDKTGKEALTLHNPDHAAVQAVLVFGHEAAQVLVDGRPAAFETKDGKTVIRTPDGFDTITVM